ncbi:MAG: hypothetical protein KDA79_04565 [Planctomycetaceae bacterium]|nr:hypothetical protein [Planctomycetaceae bacterium]
MIRSVVLIIGVICVGLVITEAAGLAYLAWTGRLTADNLRDIQTVLSGESLYGQQEVQEDFQQQHSSEQVMQQRVRAILQLKTREEELDRFHLMIETLAKELSSEKEQFRQQKLAFQQELKLAEERETAEATEQSRGILGKLRPDDAAASLMTLTLEENVVVLRGMQDRLIGRILQSFGNSPDPALVERGQKIFEAITRGEPDRKLISEQQNLLEGSGRTAARE